MPGDDDALSTSDIAEETNFPPLHTNDRTESSVADEIETSVFEELELGPEAAEAILHSWKGLIENASSTEACGELLYQAFYEGAPSLQSLFVTPRAIQAMKFLSGFNSFVQVAGDPAALKLQVETLGFAHLMLDVTIPRVIMIRDALLDMFTVEMGDAFTQEAQEAWLSLLTYIGGAFIYIKVNYAARLRILTESWQQCNNSERRNQTEEAAEHKVRADSAGSEADAKKHHKDKGKKKHKEEKKTADEDATGNDKSNKNPGLAQNVPTTYKEMFEFNAAVMGFGNSSWMNEVLACFDNIVGNVANTARLQEECDILVLRISKVCSKVNLSEYKSCMLATLRSLLPKNWSTQHEVAWCWLWENVERLLAATMGLPPVWEKALSKLLGSLDEAKAYDLREQIYARFFATAPTGQDYFKQSNTYLHLIMSKVIELTMHFYREPVKVVDDISAIGLRHVGYGIPTDIFPPFVNSVLECAQQITEDQLAIESFRWSLGLIAKSLVRTIMEGSTIVMKAINANSAKMMRKAISCAPRGERAKWMLIVQVGTQSISPLRWSLEAGALEAASAMIKDLTTIRADRDKYYYGADDLFGRHHDIVKMLIDNAPALLPELLEGLVWRSRIMHNGNRRVNYYLQYLLVHEGKFAKTLEWLVWANDPVIVCHPILTYLSDLVWTGVASRAFLYRKLWFLGTLVIFIVSQDILDHAIEDPNHKPWQRYLLFFLRSFIYIGSMGAMIYGHTRKLLTCMRQGDVFRAGPLLIPGYLKRWQEMVGFLLMLNLIGMMSFEPILYCFADPDTELFDPSCEASEPIYFFPYSFFSMLAMWFYIGLLVDLAVFNNRISSFVLTVQTLMPEAGLFCMGTLCCLVAFSSALCNLEQHLEKFQVLWTCSQALFEMVVRMFDNKEFKEIDMSKFTEVVVLAGCWCVLLFIQVFLGSVLAAQLTCAYEANYRNMVGYARLKRMQIIIESMPHVSERKWNKFLDRLQLNNRIDFNEGDVGLTGGVPLFEPASLHPDTVDAIKRFGGSTSPGMQWPEEEEVVHGDNFDRLERYIVKSLTKVIKSLNGKKAKGASSMGSSMGSSRGSSMGSVMGGASMLG